MPRKAPDLVGVRFGRLVATATRVVRGRRMWKCTCDCGATKLVATSHLVHGKIVSCGCYNDDLRTQRNFRHGGAGTLAYASWRSMIQRCTNPQRRGYHRYGGRGIRVCERWFAYDNFLADMGPRPSGMTLDRVDNDGNYELGNCRWATYAQQAANRPIPRHNVKLTIDTAQEALGRIEHGESRESVARRLGVSVGCIALLYRGVTWKELDRPWLQR